MPIYIYIGTYLVTRKTLTMVTYHRYERYYGNPCCYGSEHIIYSYKYGYKWII